MTIAIVLLSVLGAVAVFLATLAGRRLDELEDLAGDLRDRVGKIELGDARPDKVLVVYPREHEVRYGPFPKCTAVAPDGRGGCVLAEGHAGIHRDSLSMLQNLRAWHDDDRWATSADPGWSWPCVTQIAPACVVCRGAGKLEAAGTQGGMRHCHGCNGTGRRI